MAVRIDWDIYEEAILICYYLNLKDGSITNEEAKAELSKRLKNKAIKQELIIDDTFRNENGMMMKLANIMFLFTEGRKGLSAYSKLDKEVYELYKTNYSKYLEILKKGFEMSDLEGDVFQLDFTQLDDYAYTTPIRCILLNEELPRIYTGWSSLYVQILKRLRKLYPEFIKANTFLTEKCLRNDLVDELKIYQLTRVAEIDKNLYAEINLSAKDIVTRIAFAIKLCNLKNEQLIINFKRNIPREKVIHNYSTQHARKALNNINPKKNGIKQAFIQWLKGTGISQKTSEIYSASISRAERFASEHGFENTDLYIEDTEIIKKTANALFQSDEFITINKNLHNQLSSAIYKLYDFAGIKEQLNYTSRRMNAISQPKKTFYDANYEKILKERFQKGYRFGSVIDRKKFIAYLQDETQQPLNISDNEIDNNIKSMGIMVDERVYIASSLFPDEKKEALISTIERKIESGARNIYFDTLFQDLSYDFEGTNIFSPEMLAAYLNAVASDKFIFYKNYLTSCNYEELNPIDELRDLLRNEGVALTYNQIFEKLPHITESRIKQLLNFYPEFINNGKESYFHKDIIHITENDLAGIKKIIEKSLIEYEYLMGSELIESIKKTYPSIFDNNSSITDVGLRKYFSSVFDKDYSFNGDIISYKKNDLTMVDVFAKFCQNTPHFTLQELSNINNQIYLETVYCNSIRINQQEFIGHKSINFPQKEIDDAIGLFCLNEYIPIKAINQYGTFPDVGFKWNEYLLESYVFNHSEQYKLVHNTFNENVCVGAIVKKNSGINNIDELFANVLANSTVILNSDSALNYLCNEGYLARRNYKGIDSIIIKAQELRNKKGKK